MKKGFMMIEICLVMMGLLMLSTITFKVLKDAAQWQKHYMFIEVSKSCGVICAIEKLTP